MATDKNASKKAFEYRMSKKVAELTQVVHMLFTRNHEKEVEIEAVKDAYEYEVELVIGDAKGKIGDLEEECRTLKSKLLSEREKLQRRMNKQLEERDEEYKMKLANVEKCLQDEKIECRNLRDLLISAQSDIEKLRQGINEQLVKKSDELDNRDKEQDRLLSRVASLEKVMQETKRQTDDTIKQISKGNNRLQKDLDQMQKLLEETFKSKESLAMKNKQLEADFKTLQKDFKRKVSEVVANRNTSNHERIQQDTTIAYVSIPTDPYRVLSFLIVLCFIANLILWFRLFCLSLNYARRGLFIYPQPDQCVSFV